MAPLWATSAFESTAAASQAEAHTGAAAAATATKAHPNHFTCVPQPEVITSDTSSGQSSDGVFVFGSATDSGSVPCLFVFGSAPPSSSPSSAWDDSAACGGAATTPQ